ncbi:MAG TPA: ABC transporter permease [Pyrinomonadaceae bacterium]|jgi:lipopolysaccharide transport system permease protein|nr:ABC transporter permease [Pyrinomonadaceae bacterium]
MSTSIKQAASIASFLGSQSSKPLRQPVSQIRPAKFWEKIDLHELWAHREVLYFLVWRDLKVRYKQTVAGTAWVLLQPLLMTLVFAVFLGGFMHAPSDGIPYPIFAFSAMLLWTFTSTAILSSSYSLVTNSQIITRIYFPRVILPISAIGVRLVDFTIASVVLFGFMIYYRVGVGPQILILPLLILEMTALALAVGVLTAALYVRYRDVGTLLPIALQVWMFVSPTVYATSVVPSKFRFIYSLNPLVGIMNGFRAALFNLPLDWTSVAISTVVILFLTIASLQIFQMLDSSFADEV